MDKDNASYILIQAVKKAYHDGVYSLGEAEVVSRAIRVMSKQEIKNETED
jgi:hypothetical protein